MSMLASLVVAADTGERAATVGKVVLWLAGVAAILVVGLALYAGAAFSVARARRFLVSDNPAIGWAVFAGGLAILALGYIAAAATLMWVGGTIAAAMVLLAVIEWDEL